MQNAPGAFSNDLRMRAAQLEQFSYDCETVVPCRVRVTAVVPIKTFEFLT